MLDTSSPNETPDLIPPKQGYSREPIFHVPFGGYAEEFGINTDIVTVDKIKNLPQNIQNSEKNENQMRKTVTKKLTISMNLQENKEKITEISVNRNLKNSEIPEIQQKKIKAIKKSPVKLPKLRIIKNFKLSPLRNLSPRNDSTIENLMNNNENENKYISPLRNSINARKFYYSIDNRLKPKVKKTSLNNEKFLRSISNQKYLTDPIISLIKNPLTPRNPILKENLHLSVPYLHHKFIIPNSFTK